MNTINAGAPLYLLEPLPGRPRLVTDQNVVISHLRAGTKVERIVLTEGVTLHELAGACLLPPEGWYCTRGDGHRGPCAAVPKVEMLPPVVSIESNYVTQRRTGHIGRVKGERRRAG